jgi:hypothetical protein
MMHHEKVRKVSQHKAYIGISEWAFKSLPKLFVRNGFLEMHSFRVIPKSSKYFFKVINQWRLLDRSGYL